MSQNRKVNIVPSGTKSNIDFNEMAGSSHSLSSGSRRVVINPPADPEYHEDESTQMLNVSCFY